MSDRRTFMRQVLGGSTAMAVSGLVRAGRILGANDRIRFGLIGSGGRGQQIFKAAIKAPNTEAAAVALASLIKSRRCILCLSKTDIAETPAATSTLKRDARGEL